MEKLAKTKMLAYETSIGEEQTDISGRPRGDVGVVPPGRAERKEVRADSDSEVELLVDSDSSDPDSSASDAGSDALRRRRRAKRKMSSNAIRSAAAGAGPSASVQVNPSASNMLTVMERLRLIREMFYSPGDRSLDDPGLAERYRVQVERLCRQMQRAEFLQLEPESGDRLQADLDFMTQHALLPGLMIPAMRHALEKTVPQTSELEKLQQESVKRMTKFIKVASAEANRGAGYARAFAPVPHVVPRGAPQPQAHAADLVLGVGEHQPRVGRNGNYIVCNICHAPGHYHDACPAGGGGGGRGRGRGGRGRGRGRDPAGPAILAPPRD